MIPLFDANAVLTGNATASIHADLEDFRPAGFDLIQHTGLMAVVHDQRVHVAVAGVKDIGDFEPETIADGVNLLQHFGKLCHWNCAIHAQVIRRYLAHSTKGTFPAFPDVFCRCEILGHANGNRAMIAGHALNKRKFFDDFRLTAFNFDDQQCLSLNGVTCTRKFLTSENCRTIHKFDGNRRAARGHDGGDTRSGVQSRIKTSQQGARGLRLFHQPYSYFCHHTQLTFRTNNHAQQVIAGQVKGLTADIDDFAFHRYEFDAEDMIGGHAVFQAMRPARVHGHVAANGAGNLAAGIWCIKQAQIIDGDGDIFVGHTSLNQGGFVFRVHVQNFVHLGQPKHDRIELWQRTTGKRRPCPPRHDRYTIVVAVLKHRGDMLGRLGQRNQHRYGAVASQTVGFIPLEFVGGGNQEFVITQ